MPRTNTPFGTHGNCRTKWDVAGIAGHMVHSRTSGGLQDLVEHTKTCGTWWDIPGLAGLGGTCQDLRDLVRPVSHSCTGM